MRRTVRLALILCLVSTASLAQTSAREKSFVPLGASCPIGIQAVIEKRETALAFQRLQVILTGWPPRSVIASRVTVRGMAPVADGPGLSEIAESLDLIRPDRPRPVAPTGNTLQSSAENPMPWLPPIGQPVIVRVTSRDSRWYAWVSGLIDVSSIDLESVSYADGTSWHASNGAPCRVAVVPSAW
jgi:hypothetical protein